MCNCTSGNLEIPGSALRAALSDKRYALARGMTVYNLPFNPSIGTSLCITYTDPSAVRCA